MKVTKCDKCRKETKEPSIFQSNLLQLHFYADDDYDEPGEGVWERVTKSFDLCDDCAKRVLYWIQGLTNGGGPD